MFQFFRKLLRRSNLGAHETYRTFKNAPLSQTPPYLSPDQFRQLSSQPIREPDQPLATKPAGFQPMPPTDSTVTPNQPASQVSATSSEPVSVQSVTPVASAGLSANLTAPFPSGEIPVSVPRSVQPLRPAEPTNGPAVPRGLSPLKPVSAQTPPPVSLDHPSIPKQEVKPSPSEQGAAKSSLSKRKAQSDKVVKTPAPDDDLGWRKRLDVALERERLATRRTNRSAPPSKEDLEELEQRRARIEKETKAEAERREKKKAIEAKEAEQDKLYQQERELYEEEYALDSEGRRLEEHEQAAGDVFGQLRGVLEGLTYAYQFSGEIDRSHQRVSHEHNRASQLLEEARATVQTRKKQVMGQQEDVYQKRQTLTAEIENLEEEIRKIQ